jgi:hypothetical protein
VLRAVLSAVTGQDSGEPAYLTGALIRVSPGQIEITPHDPLSH